jgi:cytochrome P450
MSPLDHVPHFDVADPTFALTSDQATRPANRAGTPPPPTASPVLRYAEMNKLLKSRQMRQGSIMWPAHNGVTEGRSPGGGTAGSSTRRARNTAGLRRLMTPAFTQDLISAQVPRFQALAGELVDDYAEPDRCEFMADSPSRIRPVAAIMLGTPEETADLARESTTLAWRWR